MVRVGSAPEPPKYQLVHEPEYDEAVSELERISRLDRVLTMLTYYIACDPFLFPLVENSDVPEMRVAPSRALGPVPSVRIFYTVNGMSVRLWYAVSDDGAPEQD